MNKNLKDEPQRVLLSAYACVPERGSEPGVGWNWFIRLARKYEVWLLTEECESAQAVRPYLTAHYPELVGRVHVVGIPRRRFGERLWKHFFYYLTYRRWQRDAYAVAERLHRQNHFALVHHLNMIGFREPGFLWKLDVPFVLGPISGAANFPWRYVGLLPFRDRLFVVIKNVLNVFQLAFSQRIRRAIAQARVVMVANGDNRALFERWYGVQGLLINETGSGPVIAKEPEESRDETLPLRLVWCGGFFPRKLLVLALRVVARASARVPVVLDIVGTGPQAAQMQQYAESLGIGDSCRWHGQLSHDGAMQKMAHADALLFTSLVEGTPHVVLEALSIGTPVLCHAISGQGDVVTADCGVKIPVRDPETSVEAFVDAVVTLASDREALERLRRGAAARAQMLSWDNLIGRVETVYETVLTTEQGERA